LLLALTHRPLFHDPSPSQDKASPVYRTSLEAAKRAFSELAAQRPGDWRLFQGLGKAREKLGEHGLALADYSRAVELSGSKLLEPLHRMRASRLKRLVATYVSGDLTVLVSGRGLPCRLAHQSPKPHHKKE